MEAKSERDKRAASSTTRKVVFTVATAMRQCRSRPHETAVKPVTEVGQEAPGQY